MIKVKTLCSAILPKERVKCRNFNTSSLIKYLNTNKHKSEFKTNWIAAGNCHCLSLNKSSSEGIEIKDHWKANTIKKMQILWGDIGNFHQWKNCIILKVARFAVNLGGVAEAVWKRKVQSKDRCCQHCFDIPSTLNCSYVGTTWSRLYGWKCYPVYTLTFIMLLTACQG